MDILGLVNTNSNHTSMPTKLAIVFFLFKKINRGSSAAAAVPSRSWGVGTQAGSRQSGVVLETPPQAWVLGAGGLGRGVRLQASTDLGVLGSDQVRCTAEGMRCS